MRKKLIKLGFFLLYNHLAFTYDFVAWAVSLGQWSKWRQTAIQYLQPGSTLELAFGTGKLFTTMTLAGSQLIGVDFSPFMARITANRLQRHHLPAPIACSRVQSLPFPTGYFANVVATFPTNYIFEPATLAEIHRVLTNTPKQGRLIVVMQGQLKGPRQASAVIEWLYRITGQREYIRANPLAQFNRAGFNAEWRRASFDKAVANLIVAQKT